ncbi:uncharacterized protein SETTUDRAFT_169470 [Exserohilum turcica Et28A]|uniref:BZIP domain-containing protein n=1 Tax=Exserohilum turcicum (strain 28A) TaxID=671987 RepID=R0KCE1_EXST2|nr:uncharacterized protein SETTUDRAFT_169470 [Exserohilum turcica Et28A]EOA85882.1 hypothetical protein SETTUDRAFT_169470 [Exserohilum turcica Et28A]
MALKQSTEARIERRREQNRISQKRRRRKNAIQIRHAMTRELLLQSGMPHATNFV